MTKILDNFYNPERWMGQTIEGQLCLVAEGTELVDLIQDASVTAQVSFTVLRERGYMVLSGAIQVDVTLLCQRSFESFVHPIKSTFKVVAIEPKQLATLDKELEPVLLNEKGMVDLKSLVQEEIVLSIPMFPVHPNSVPLGSELK